MTKAEIDPERVSAIVVGVSEYTGTNPLTPLKASSLDARRFCDALIEKGIPRQRIRMFVSPTSDDTDERAPSFDAIWKTLTDGLADEEGDLLVIFWSGHGYSLGQRVRRVAFADTTFRNLLTLDVGGLTQYVRTRHLNFKEVVIVVDACGQWFRLKGVRTLPSHDFPDVDFRDGGDSGVVPVVTLFSVGHNELADAEAGGDDSTSKFFRLFLPLFQAEELGTEALLRIANDLRTAYKEVKDTSAPLFYAENANGSDIVTPGILVAELTQELDRNEDALPLRAYAWELSGFKRGLLNPKELWRYRGELLLAWRSPAKSSSERFLRASAAAAAKAMTVLVLCAAAVLAAAWAIAGLTVFESRQSRFISRLNAMQDIRELNPLLNDYSSWVGGFANATRTSYHSIDLESEPPDLYSADDPRRMAVRKKAIRALALTRMGEFGDFFSILGDPSQSTLRTCAVLWAPTVLEDPGNLVDAWAARRQSAPNNEVDYGILLLLAQYPPKTILRLDETSKLDIVHALGISPDAGVRTTSLFALSRAGISLRPASGPSPESSSPPTPGFMVDQYGGEYATFSDVESFDVSLSRNPDAIVDLSRPFAIGLHEVTTGEFRAYLNDEGLSPPPRITQFDDRPIDYVSWFEATKYCDWLSRKHGLSPCYQLSKEGDSPPSDALDLNGYRLPTFAEWQFACRARTRGRAFFGNDASLSGCFIQAGNISLRAYGDRRSVAPNRFGCVHMLGNVEEWIHDQADYVGDLTGHAGVVMSGESTGHGPPYSVCGGLLSSRESSAHLTSYYWQTRPGRGERGTGFRIARSLID